MLRRSPLRRHKPLNPTSKRQRDRQDRLRQIAESLGPFVECAWPGCGQPPDDLHHVKRRSQSSDDEVIALCRTHHDLCHREPAEARRLGFLKRSWE